MTSTGFDEEHHGTIAVHVESDRYRVVLSGEIDGARRDEASAALAAVVLGARPVDIETSDVTFIDSSGVAFLVQVLSIGAEEGFPVTLVEPADVVLDVLRMIGLDERFTIASSGPEPVELTSLVG